MDTNPDKHFFNLFLLVIGALVGVSFGLFLLANFIAGSTQEVYVLQDKAYQTAVETRIAPVGRVLPNRETATSSVSLSAMMPEPTTVHTSAQVPRASAASLRGRSKSLILFYPYCLPISSSRRVRLNRSILRIGKFTNAAMRLFMRR